MLSQADTVIRSAPKGELLELLRAQASEAEKQSASATLFIGRQGGAANAKACRNAISAIESGSIMPDLGAMIVALNHACNLQGISRARRTAIAIAYESELVAAGIATLEGESV